LNTAIPLKPIDGLLAELGAFLPVPGTERVAIDAAIGHVLAEDLIVPGDIPPGPVASLSGYAVTSRDLIGASSYSPVPLANRQPVRAGDPIPTECDAVISVDSVEGEGVFAGAIFSPAPGENARLAGEDARADATLRPKGSILRVTDAAAATACGVATAEIRKVPVGIACSGFLERLVASLPGVSPGVGSADAPIRIILSPEPREVVPAGRVLAEGLALAGAEQVRVIATDRAAVLVVPPWPAAMLAAAFGVIDPLVAALVSCGRRPTRCGPLSAKVSSRVGLAEIVILAETKNGLEPLEGGALSLTAFAQADAILHLPPESEGFAAGEHVKAAAL
jgi:molybdopterin molybdotransferase